VVFLGVTEISIGSLTKVFANFLISSEKVAENIRVKGITAAAIHGNKSQGARTRALADFKAGKVNVLVATDIAARGIDIVESGVKHQKSYS
jgi:ATP-dependent RNA helicase RhlE